MRDTLALWEWRRAVVALYAHARAAASPEIGWAGWRTGRDELFADHPQSPLPDRAGFNGLPFFGYDPALRFQVTLRPDAGETLPVMLGADGTIDLRPFARTEGLQPRLGGELTLFWIEGYGGGVFLPFTDATNATTTYGGGRYLLDTIKGADLGTIGPDAAVLDFNFAYNPSCSYSDDYVCPLAPAQNRLGAAVEAGEKRSR